ncbi:unnamed protein product [Dracunculus medinensis]|uniref:SAC domain-containing protein n=1 Tax=Dracunculus medinensis TaxID=318479 RepID=A0A158Q680_DRAME|nr:unnamed protein product [Dracunculus medinensis]
MHEIGDVYGIIGVLKFESLAFLLVITKRSPVACFPCTQAKIYHIDCVTPIPIEIESNNIADAKMRLDNVKLRNYAQRKLMKFLSDKIQPVNLVEEILHLFNDNGDFYVCFEKNLTLSAQRYGSGVQWVDDRFFWNRNLLRDLFDNAGNPIDGSHSWILSICQGFIVERYISLNEDSQLILTLISRRSVKRAGVRYLRRGIDDEANVANFVETEMVLSLFGHHLSFVQIRGSVPVYWSQRGYRYRPPLIIDKCLSDSLDVFKKHMKNLIDKYGSPIIVVNLVDQTGRELNLATSYVDHILAADVPEISYYSFDFHFHCRALRFYKVNDLILAIYDKLNSLGFCWMDKHGEMVYKQKGVVRTNCVDCLDRTNVVQCAISQALCLKQIQKLGLVGPLSDSPDILVQCLQSMWADNGDAISRQYAGTNALKGDVTRCGQRKFVGIVKDGNIISEPPSEKSENELEDESESIERLVHETIHFVLPEKEILVGSWALIDSSNQSDQIDTVVLLTKLCIIITLYDDDSEKILEVKILDFNDIIRLELGSFDKTSKIHLRIEARSNQQFTWRAAKTRLFNNAAIPLKTSEECDEYIQAIGEQMKVTMAMAGKEVELSVVEQLSRQTNRTKLEFH